MYYFLLRREGGGESVNFPINPESLDIVMAAKNESSHLLNLGEYANPGAALCRVVSLSSVLPASSYPYEIVKRWQDYINEGTVLRLIISGNEPWGDSRFELNMSCLIEKITYAEKGGEPGNVFFDMTLKEYRPFSLKVIS